MVQTTATQLKNRLRRADGQLQGILKMVEEGRDCQDVLTQLAAVRSGVDRMMGVVAAENVKQCLADSQLDTAQQAKLQAALDLVVKTH
ncbi:MAG: metal-sensitive transcriptional regulator [Levilactobacillus sp.]|uniref:Metal-sensitive transcriptional regulator n=1 Tax=Levilactobacillus suantsaiihabitans TaxID=2487722 RepID=A0A4Z0JCZ9_9LACO|nr:MULTISPECIES: metal-sensitive transcriptional regulator [Levilactobacillus]MCI1553377.1 metal-sensitive transcriptional regulator [Levilactobacillus sp.]MCI1599088.1 metal-sensitive transcriptional regulator [Levilactobacillus sp.]MCI1606581.1 metal-sensitive transcriptional regulator [Levilactobacillus sp.]TGD19782.1 metal-sensitive transcriptional regulator [Levilactobacillus suantsaiihabitans]